MLTNHHTHTLYSDGSSQPVEYIEEAISRGFGLLAFTEHSPLPFENPFSFRDENRDEYINLMRDLKQRYAGQLAIYSGMEMDYIPRYVGKFLKNQARI